MGARKNAVLKFRAVKQTKAIAEIVERICALIGRGELKPEGHLPSERTLSASFGIGRPVRAQRHPVPVDVRDQRKASRAMPAHQ